MQRNQNNSDKKLEMDESNRYVTERESTSISRNHLYNTTSTVIQQQNVKNILNGPKSPTEASIAPTCYNGALNNSKNGKWVTLIVMHSITKSLLAPNFKKTNYLHEASIDSLENKNILLYFGQSKKCTSKSASKENWAQYIEL